MVCTCAGQRFRGPRPVTVGETGGNGVKNSRAGPWWRAGPDSAGGAGQGQDRSNRSRSMTFAQAATKSVTNFAFASSLA